MPRASPPGYDGVDVPGGRRVATKKIAEEADWPRSWQASYAYDLMEVYGQVTDRGYVYQYEQRRRHALELVRLAAGPGARVLDVAAAQGNFSLALAEEGYEVTWNDLRSELADYVRLKHERGDITYLPGDICRIDCPGSYDVVLATEVIEHVAHPDEFLMRIAALVRSGGHVVITTPNGAYFRNRLPRFSDCPDPASYEAMQFGPDAEDHIFLLQRDEVERLAAASGLAVVELRYFSNPLTAGHVKLGPLLRVLPRACVAAAEALTTRLPGLAPRLHSGMAALLRRGG